MLQINLAKSTGTTQRIINLLALEESLEIKKAALSRCSDTETLDKSFKQAYNSVDIGLLQSLARNTYLDPNKLIKLLDHPNSSIKILAYINPSTPEEARREKLNHDKFLFSG